MAFPYLGLKGPLKRLIYIFLVFSVGFVGYFIRIEVIHLVDLALPPLFEYFCLVWDVHVIGGVLASTGPYGAERSPPAGESQTEEGEPSVNQGTEEAGPVLPANPGGQEAANQAPPYVPYPYQPNEVIGGDSVEYIERRLLERLVFPSAHEILFARIEAQDLFEVKVKIIQLMALYDPTGDWMGQGARALDNPKTASGEESLKRLYEILDDLKETGPLSDEFSRLQGKVFRRE
ncbi:unnamed protein product [Cuscuta epithymum]|uniref:DUF8018 domain-containing protein n=1 Tax=Cuscuta epithymum TaxID=186058 RepID=A0AAV0DZB6_9ASTE|nr:unnamed protein product [Cuscuta epithymum]